VTEWAQFRALDLDGLKLELKQLIIGVRAISQLEDMAARRR
jgi:hypothetical protein